MSVLVLNATYEPLNIVSVRRATILLLKEKAEIVEAAEAYMRAEHISLPVPLVIRLVAFVPVPRRLVLPVSRRTVLARDQFTCQYCGEQLGKSQLTIDHLLPRSRGGKTVWENVVVACGSCNRKKGDQTPDEANMVLRSRPTRPRYLALVLLQDSHTNGIWQKYL
jgi:5-methylcytosine-specific restriction endonuclease McrA